MLIINLYWNGFLFYGYCFYLFIMIFYKVSGLYIEFKSLVYKIDFYYKNYIYFLYVYLYEDRENGLNGCIMFVGVVL